MVAKAPTFIVEYGKDAESRRSDDRLCGPVFEKNHQFIGEVIKRLLGSRKGNVIEIGSGTGQHAARFARDFPNLTWWPTDLRPLHLISIEAWRHYSGENNMMPSVLLDAAQAEWKLGKPNMPPSENVVAILCINACI